ncbi:MAG: alpha/beta hydrolase [Lachnospiraceae bacterium]|nr:alpha/beta hydrolase [Lachnospiraceae bacterium]
METKRITLHQEDKTTTVVYACLSDVSTPIGSILLLHDMAEHHGRFDDFIRVLNGKGYDTYSYDHRGHGAEIRYEDLGHIADEDGYEVLISDALHVLKYVKKANRGRKLILFGAGMGALIARCLLPLFDSLNACILCSCPNPTHKKLNSLMTSARIAKFSKKPRYKSVRLGKKFTEFKGFSKISSRTSFDWISRDNQLVGAYISDPLCGFLGTVSFYSDILRLTDEAVAKTNMKQVRNDLPILLLAGSHDPVCDYGEEVTELFDNLQRYHLSEVDCTIYEECRHDLLHETNNAEIFKDILEWLSRALDNRRLKAAAAMREKKKKKGQTRNRTAAEAARSALGYASDENDELKGSINAEDVGDDDDFLEDMGYFNRRSAYNPSEIDEGEEFIISDEDDEDFALLEYEEEEEKEDEKPKDKNAEKSSKKKSTKDTKKNKKDEKKDTDSVEESDEETEKATETKEEEDKESEEKQEQKESQKAPGKKKRKK